MMAGCSTNISQSEKASPTLRIPTVTLSPTLTPHLTKTLLPSAPSATTVPMEGITSSQVNVRAEPSTASAVLGMIPPDTRIEIIGKDPGGGWWQIRYSQGAVQNADGTGWVTAQYVTTIGTPEVPVIGGSHPNANFGNVAIIQERLNVRSGPGADFNSLGTLNPQDVVNLLGKDPNGAWLQIDFASGPEGKGWISSGFVQARGVENLPIISQSGAVVGTGTPTEIPLTPTSTLIPAWLDHDSASHPILSVTFEALGTRRLIYNGDVSVPQGDREDWVAFQTYNSPIFVSLECQGGDALAVDWTVNSQPAGHELACGDLAKKINVFPGESHLIHFQALAAGDVLHYVAYMLMIEAGP